MAKIEPKEAYTGKTERLAELKRTMRKAKACGMEKIVHQGKIRVEARESERKRNTRVKI